VAVQAGHTGEAAAARKPERGARRACQAGREQEARGSPPRAARGGRTVVWRRGFQGESRGGVRELGLGVESDGYNWSHET
jgi:hypothetical protein